MKVGRYDLTIYQGSTFTLQITWKDSEGDPINLTGYSARMQIRPSKNSSTKMADLSTTNGKIVLGGVAGTIALNIPAIDTAKIANNGVYDLEIESPGGTVTRLIEGLVEVSGEVSR